MTLRAPDVKDEHGWQILGDEDRIVGHATSRDWARKYVQNPSDENAIEKVVAATRLSEDGAQQGEVLAALPHDNTPEAIAARTAHDVDQRIRAAVKTMRGAWVDLAGELYVFYENKMWEALGHESWDAYFADPDISLNPRWAYDQLAVYRQLVVERGVDPMRLKTLEVSKVTKVLPAVRRDRVTVDEALSDVEALSRNDLEAKYSGRFQPQKDQRGKPDTSSTIHTESEPVWAVCPTCQSRYRVDPETGERVDP